MTDKSSNPKLSKDTIDQAAQAVLGNELQQEDAYESTGTQDAMASTKRPSTAKGSALAILLGASALLVSLAGIGTGYYLYQNSTRQQPDANSTAAIEQTLSTQSADFAAQMDEKIGSVNSTLSESGEVIDALEQRQQTLEDNFNLIRSQTNGNNRDWSLAGIQYLIQIAADRLTFMRDRETAIAALQTARSRLKKLGDPSFEALSRRLSDDVLRLEQYQANHPLDALQTLENEFSKLAPTPTASQSKEASEPTNTADAPASLKQTLQSSLLKRFRVRHHDQPLNALDRNTIDWQNMSILQLRLEGLKLALQQDNQTAFKHALVSIRQWVVTHLQAAQQQSILAELDNLSVENVFPAPPDLDETQSILRALLRQASAA